MAEFHEVPRQLPASFGSRRGEPGQRRGFRPQTQRPQRLPEPVLDGSRLQSSADSLSPQTDAVTACGSGEPRRALGPGPIPPRGPSPTARAVVPGVVTCSNVPNGDNPGPPTANASFRKST